ncbi:MAG TPA: hypothetical protein DCQ54_01950 [Gammaproteobacteria bacterium]|nr:hypothetical protein [Gammaproteobacteria bacterium]
MHKSTVKFLILFIVPSSVNALSESEFVQSLLSNNIFFEKEQINLTIKQIEMEGDKANYGDWDWTIGGELGRINKNKTKYDYTSTTDYAKSTSQEVRKFSSDLTKKFFSNGSELSISYDKSLPVKNEEMHDKNGYQTDKNTTEYLDDTSISWTLPLLKNKGGVVDQKTYDLAVLDFEDEKLALAETKEDFIEEKLIIFLDWVSYNTQISIVRKRLEQSEKILEILIQKGASRISKITLQRSINKIQRLLLELESKLKAEQRSLSILLDGLDLTQNPLKINWAARAQLIEDLYSYFQQSIRDIKRIEIEQLKNSRSVRTYQNSQLADFDFTISATKDDNKGNYSTYSKSSEVEYEAKIEFSYPLTGNVSNDVYLRKYRLKGRQLELKYKDKFDAILSDAQKLTTELKQGLKQLALYKQQIDENRAGKTETEFDAFLAGNSNIRFVIIENDDNQSLLLDQVEASINYHKNRIKYDSLMDRLLFNAE